MNATARKETWRDERRETKHCKAWDEERSDARWDDFFGSSMSLTIVLWTFGGQPVKDCVQEGKYG